MQLESASHVEFVALNEAGEDRGLILAEVVGVKSTQKLQLEFIVIEPVAAEQPEVLAWAQEHLTALAALYVVPGRSYFFPCLLSWAEPRHCPFGESGNTRHRMSTPYSDAEPFSPC